MKFYLITNFSYVRPRRCGVLFRENCFSQKAINHRHLNISEIQIDHTDNHFIKTINETLESDDINQQLFAVELIKDLEMDQWRQTLNKLLLAIYR